MDEKLGYSRTWLNAHWVSFGHFRQQMGQQITLMLFE